MIQHIFENTNKQNLEKFMKTTIFTFLILVLSIISCDSATDVITEPQITIDEIMQSNDPVKISYLKDASVIEFNELIKDSTKMNEQVELSESAIISYYVDLLFIHNNSDKISNSFFAHSDIHSYATSSMYQITAAVSYNVAWTENWKNGDAHTGISEIDAIMTKYNLSANYGLIFSTTDVFTIKSEKALNYYALIEKFKNTNKFTFVEQDGGMGDGSDIALLKIEDGYRYYKYSFRWGDCPAGCINRHYWVIKVKGGEVVLDEEGGDSLE